MKNCPVCGLEQTEPMPDFCPRKGCGWELKNDLTLVPSLDMPDSAVESYKKRLEIARRNFQLLKKLAKEKAELKNRLDVVQKSFDRKATRQTAHTEIKEEVSDESKIEIGNTTETTMEYLVETPIPLLKCGQFETVEQFDARINEHPPFQAGVCELRTDRYYIETGRFLVRVKWEVDLASIAGLSDYDRFPHIVVNQETARAMSDNGSQYPISVSARSADGLVSVNEISVIWKEKKIALLGEVCDWVEPVTGMEFIYVPRGTFKMGDIFEDGPPYEKPVHLVQLDPFYMGKYPVTQGQWQKVMPENPSTFKNGNDYPVERVSWYDAKAFIKKLETMNGEKIKLCLPTEAQWEYAARSGGKKERYAGGDDVKSVAWHAGNTIFGFESTQFVGKMKPNGLGIYDMSGNVWEWCEDIFSENAYRKHQRKNPEYVESGSRRVVRGGSYRMFADGVRCAFRAAEWPDTRNSYKDGGDLGFRIARKI